MLIQGRAACRLVRDSRSVQLAVGRHRTLELVFGKAKGGMWATSGGLLLAPGKGKKGGDGKVRVWVGVVRWGIASLGRAVE